jgi:Ran GTPase-activating protein (RanGAP) involved in mRNA processing and transport
MDALVEMLSSSPSLEQFSFLKAEAPLSAGRLIAQSLLVDHCKLESLDLSGLDVDEDGVEAIGNLVKASNGMKSLSLSELPQVIDVSFLADALLSNTTLIQLDLSSNRLSHGDTLSKALQTNQTLQSLNLSRATWEDVDDSTDDTCMAVPSFYTSLGGCRGLLHLDLSYMYLSPQNVSDLAASLRENNSLERLLLNDLDRSFEPVQLEFVFDALRVNTRLRVLELGRNTFRQDEIQTLVQSLSANESLESLSLCGCGLTDDGIVQLSQSLPKLSLKDLDLSFNDIGRGGATAILEMLPKTLTLRSLSLYNSCWSIGGPTHFDCDGFEDINQAIQDCLNRRNG